MAQRKIPDLLEEIWQELGCDGPIVQDWEEFRRIVDAMLRSWGWFEAVAEQHEAARRVQEQSLQPEPWPEPSAVRERRERMAPRREPAGMEI